ncbi:MAG TPA: 3-isopropylmalate dehydratase small subunit [Thermoleophilaceae bacterium]
MKAISVIDGAVSVLDRDNVDTDQIVPKQFLKRVERTGFGEYLFYDWAKQPGWDLPANPILATGRNFGSGSSREHAPWALEDYGFEAVVAPSFADIFYSNCTKIGLLPVVLPEEDVRELMQAGHARIDLQEQEISFAGRQVPFDIDPETARRLLEGLDDIGATLQQERAIDAYERERERSGPVTTQGALREAGGHPASGSL